MSLNADLREFIELLNSRGVEYVIVGAHSLAFHARPRYTGDLDILVRPSPENAAKLVSLLHDFGFEKADFTEADFTVPQQMIQLGRAPNRVDLLTSISGVDIDDAFRTKILTEMDGLHSRSRRLGRRLTTGKRARLVSRQLPLRSTATPAALPAVFARPTRFARSFGVTGSH